MNFASPEGCEKMAPGGYLEKVYFNNSLCCFDRYR
jgi:hypothetical protein